MLLLPLFSLCTPKIDSRDFPPLEQVLKVRGDAKEGGFHWANRGLLHKENDHMGYKIPISNKMLVLIFTSVR